MRLAATRQIISHLAISSYAFLDAGFLRREPQKYHQIDCVGKRTADSLGDDAPPGIVTAAICRRSQDDL